MALPFHLVFLLCLTSGLLISGTWSANIERRAAGCPGGWTAVGNRCFIARADKKNVIGAWVSCRRLGGELASIHSGSENYWAKRLLRQLFGKDVEAWIGLTDANHEGWWEWTDGSRVDYTAWRKRQPNDKKGQDCVSIKHRSGTGWNDSDCGKRFPYVCSRDQ